jgi:hypothetical protein
MAKEPKPFWKKVKNFFITIGKICLVASVDVDSYFVANYITSGSGWVVAGLTSGGVAKTIL